MLQGYEYTSTVSRTPCSVCQSHSHHLAASRHPCERCLLPNLLPMQTRGHSFLDQQGWTTRLPEFLCSRSSLMPFDLCEPTKQSHREPAPQRERKGPWTKEYEEDQQISYASSNGAFLLYQYSVSDTFSGTITFTHLRSFKAGSRPPVLSRIGYRWPRSFDDYTVLGPGWRGKDPAFVKKAMNRDKLYLVLRRSNSKHTKCISIEEKNRIYHNFYVPNPSY